MPITAEQAQRIDAYYEAGEDYSKLLLSAADDAPPDLPRTHPLKYRKVKEQQANTDVKRPEPEQSKDPKPGQFFQELVETLKKHKISKPGEDGAGIKK